FEALRQGVIPVSDSESSVGANQGVDNGRRHSGGVVACKFHGHSFLVAAFVRWVERQRKLLTCFACLKRSYALVRFIRSPPIRVTIRLDGIAAGSGKEKK